MGEEFILRGREALDEVSTESLGKQLYGRLLEYRHRPLAFTDVALEKSISYETLLQESCYLAESLRKYGIRQNDVVAVCSENNVEFFYPVLASLYLGCAVTTISPHYSAGEIIHAVNISKPAIIFCSKTHVKSILEIKHQLTSVQNIVVIDSEEIQEGCSTLAEFTANSRNINVLAFEIAEIDVKEHPAFILYSSGTTGLSKAVVLTHRNVNFSMAALRDPRFNEWFSPELAGTKTFLGIAPFFHMYGLYIGLITMTTAGKTAILKSFDPKIFLQTIQDFKLTELFLVPPLAQFLSRSALLDEYDLSSVTTISCGTAPLDSKTRELLLQRMKITKYNELYGLTESGAIVLCPIGNVKRNSCGIVAANAMAKVIDIKTGKPLGPNQKGELCFKGHMIMTRYMDNSEATKQSIDEDGWLHSGDIGYYDEDGYFYVVDRLKELIKYKGFQVPPAELEGLLLTHPKIADAGVIGLPDERCGELPLAFVVVQPGETLSERDIIDFIARRVSIQKRLHGGVRFIKEIPKTATGKILRRVLRDLLVVNAKSKL